VLDHLGRSEPAVLLHYRSVRVDSHRAWELNSEASTELLVDKGDKGDFFGLLDWLRGRGPLKPKKSVQLLLTLFPSLSPFSVYC
jgi:hypothetical protein